MIPGAPQGASFIFTVCGEPMKIFIASDHAAFEEKSKLIAHLREHYEIHDLGPLSSDRCNYPDYASAVAKSVVSDPESRGILLCGSGIGMSMVANRYQGIRAALTRTVEDAQLAREHNNANVICFGSRTSSFEDIKKMTDLFLVEKFAEGRHAERLELFNSLGQK